MGAARKIEYDPDRLYTVQEYLDFTAQEEAGEGKYEYVDGRIINIRESYAEGMAGGSRRHSRLSANVIVEIGSRLRRQPCEVFESNLRVRVGTTVRYRYPDATIVCGGAVFDPEDESEITLLNPRVVIEVLSPGSERVDRSDKLLDYMQIESLREYVLVSQTERRVESYSRRDDGTWLLRIVGENDAEFAFASIELKLPMDDLYAGVKIEPARGAPPKA